ncbi:hypothetical protein C0991_007950 [Blastosporella zonata]|nr:hypothetical protein C0991_007950 [Blastosporella zonata]
MPPRLKKRQQRALEELSALGPSDVVSSDEEPVGKAKSRAGDDELEQALAELSLKYSSHTSSTPTSTTTTHPPPANAISAFLAVSLVHLEPTAEMPKFFGSKVFRSFALAPGSSSNSHGARKSALAALHCIAHMGSVAQFLQGLRGQFPGGLERLGPEDVEDVLGQVQGMIGAQDELHGWGIVEMPGAFAVVAAPAPPGG